MSVLEKILDLLFKKTPITREDNELYLIRWSWTFGRLFGIKIHKFYQSDDMCLHDHPWPFWSFIINKGYYEWTYQDVSDKNVLEEKQLGGHMIVKKQYRPFSLLYRPANWIHRIELLQDKEGKNISAWTIVITGKVVRKWGFWTVAGRWIYYRDYVSKFHCNA